MNWNLKAKRLLKAELVKRGISNADLVRLLGEIGVEETKASIDSKISRGTFSASFLIQCLLAIGCYKFVIDDFDQPFLVAADPKAKYELSQDE